MEREYESWAEMVEEEERRETRVEGFFAKTPHDTWGNEIKLKWSALAERVRALQTMGVGGWYPVVTEKYATKLRVISEEIAGVGANGQARKRAAVRALNKFADTLDSAEQLTTSDGPFIGTSGDISFARPFDFSGFFSRQ